MAGSLVEKALALWCLEIRGQEALTVRQDLDDHKRAVGDVLAQSVCRRRRRSQTWNST